MHIPDFKSVAAEMSAEHWFYCPICPSQPAAQKVSENFSPCDKTVANSGAQLPTKFQVSRGPGCRDMDDSLFWKIVTRN